MLIADAEKQEVMKGYQQSGNREIASMLFPWHSSSPLERTEIMNW